MADLTAGEGEGTVAEDTAAESLGSARRDFAALQPQNRVRHHENAAAAIPEGHFAGLLEVQGGALCLTFFNDAVFAQKEGPVQYIDAASIYPRFTGGDGAAGHRGLRAVGVDAAAVVQGGAAAYLSAGYDKSSVESQINTAAVVGYREIADGAAGHL